MHKLTVSFALTDDETLWCRDYTLDKKKSIIEILIAIYYMVCMKKKNII